MFRPTVILALLAAVAGGPAVGQTQPVPVPVPTTVPEAAAPQPAPAPRPATVKVSLQTSEGPIVLELEKERAPITTANFLRYVDQKRLDGTTFYRALNLAPGYGLIQGGLRNDPRKLFPPIAHEATTKTGLSHGDGTISMARNTPGSATADFFIVLGEMKGLIAFPSFHTVMAALTVYAAAAVPRAFWPAVISVILRIPRASRMLCGSRLESGVCSR